MVALPSVLVGWVVGRGQTSLPNDAVAVKCDTSRTETAGGEPSQKREKPSQNDPDVVLRDVFSKPIAGATVNGEVTLYADKGLFDYIDGAAPIYIERHFRKLAAAELVLAGGGELTSDVYDMRKPENAESIFTAERSASAEDVPSWPKAITGPRSFVFQHDRYYVKLTAFDAKSEAALHDVASEIKSRLK